MMVKRDVLTSSDQFGRFHTLHSALPSASLQHGHPPGLTIQPHSGLLEKDGREVLLADCDGEA
jgi:hypothetical protein